MQNSGLDEAQAGIKIVRKNINNLKYTDDTTLKAENLSPLLKTILIICRVHHEKCWTG